ncbi:unnamed protein product, partial [Prorocentrum cordatum]
PEAVAIGFNPIRLSLAHHLDAMGVLRRPAGLAQKTPALLHVVLGKSPGETLRRDGDQAYSLTAQRKACTSTFDRKFGKKKWKVIQWHTRDVSARQSKAWPKQLKAIIAQAKADGAILATSAVCRMLRSKRDCITVEDANVRLLLCEHDGIDASTPTGRYFFCQQVLSAELEARLCGERTKAALQVAKGKGMKLGTQNPKVRNKSAWSQRDAALDRARALWPMMGKAVEAGHGAPWIADMLNGKTKAKKINNCKCFHAGPVQRIMKRQKKLKLF